MEPQIVSFSTDSRQHWKVRFLPESDDAWDAPIIGWAVVTRGSSSAIEPVFIDDGLEQPLLVSADTLAGSGTVWTVVPTSRQLPTRETAKADRINEIVKLLDRHGVDRGFGRERLRQAGAKLGVRIGTSSWEEIVRIRKRG